MPFDVGAFNVLAPEIEAQDEGDYAEQNRGLPQFFTPLVGRKVHRHGRVTFAGRTMPVDEAQSLQDVDILNVEGMPSVNLFLGDNDNATITIERHSQYWEYFDDADRDTVETLAEEIYNALIAYSDGPYSLRMLRQMGHPYGYGPGVTKSGHRKRRHVPRKYGGASIGYAAGVRGSVPTMSVINTQSGQLHAKWEMKVEYLEDGYRLHFWNTAKTPKGNKPYPWFLAAGTGRMQPHGPWTEVPNQFTRRLNSAHQRAVRRARHRALALDMALGGVG